ncbi:MAG: OmpA family protein [bacterium]|nr:OmpA family protein [bacterium]
MKRFLFFSLLILFAVNQAFGQFKTGNLSDLKNKAKDQAGSVGSQVYEALAKEFLKVAKDIPFDYNSSELRLNDPKYSVAGYNIDDFMKKVLIPALSKLVNALPSDKKVLLIGHASASGTEEPSGRFMGNTALSQKRAEAVLNYILKNSQLTEGKFEIQAKGSTSPKSGTDPVDNVNCRTGFGLQ